MRMLFIFIFLAHACVAVAAPKIRQKTNNGFWGNTNTWDLNRVPQHADTVVIPSGNVLIIDDHQNLGNSKLIVMVYGTLQFTGVGKLTLNENSAVFIQSGGIIDGNGSNAQKLRIGDQQLTGNEIQVAASHNALLLTATTSSYEPVTPNSEFASFAILPVIFRSFTLSAIGDAVELKWSTVSEQNNKHFEIERSYNNATWTRIATVAAGATTTTINYYSYTDKGAINGTVRYRIKQVDEDGRFVYTAQRSITLGGKVPVQIWSTPNKVAIHFPEPVSGAVEVRFVSMSGQVVGQETIKQPAGQMMLDKKGQKGYHVVIVTNAKGINVAQKVNL